MTHVVTATHPITLEGGRSVEPGAKVNVKSSDPYIAGLIESGKLVELPKKAAKPRTQKTETPSEKEESK
jgi:hypothetical protein